MKPCAHLRLFTLQCRLKSTHILPAYRYRNLHTIQSTADNASNSSNNQSSDNERPFRSATQYPPPPLQERYSKPIKKSGAKIEPFREVQFKPKSESTDTPIPKAGIIPNAEVDENNIVDKDSPLPSSPEEELSLGGVNIDPLELKKMIPHGTASKQEIEEALQEENAEWKGVHWSERHYTAKLGDIVNRQRPEEVSRMMESSKPPVHRPGMRSIQPVEAGGPAYPIFYDPKSGDGLNRPQANIPRDIDGRKARVTHIASLYKVTGISHSECALEYDQAQGQYTIALERLRNKQVDKLVSLTKKTKDECKKVFDQCLGNFDKALRKLKR